MPLLNLAPKGAKLRRGYTYFEKKAPLGAFILKISMPLLEIALRAISRRGYIIRLEPAPLKGGRSSLMICPLEE